jgi:hypothetical protein
MMNITVKIFFTCAIIGVVLIGLIKVTPSTNKRFDLCSLWVFMFIGDAFIAIASLIAYIWIS